MPHRNRLECITSDRPIRNQKVRFVCKNLLLMIVSVHERNDLSHGYNMRWLFFEIRSMEETDARVAWTSWTLQSDISSYVPLTWVVRRHG